MNKKQAGTYQCLSLCHVCQGRDYEIFFENKISVLLPFFYTIFGCFLIVKHINKAIKLSAPATYKLETTLK